MNIPTQISFLMKTCKHNNLETTPIQKKQSIIETDWLHG